MRTTPLNPNDSISMNPISKIVAAVFLVTASQTFVRADTITPSSAGWQLVRHVDTVGGWDNINDNLAGNAIYGTFGTETSVGDFSVNFSAAVAGWDQVLFMFGDHSKWMVMSRSELSKTVSGQPLTILDSYLNSNSYTALMYNRVGVPEDPWLSATDHFSAIGTGDILYGEAGFGGPHFANGAAIHQGANVFIRNSATASAVPDSGLTVTLLGFSLASMLWFRRKSSHA
jgi:hypothetical protein